MPWRYRQIRERVIYIAAHSAVQVQLVVNVILTLRKFPIRLSHVVSTGFVDRLTPEGVFSETNKLFLNPSGYENELTVNCKRNKINFLIVKHVGYITKFLENNKPTSACSELILID